MLVDRVKIFFPIEGASNSGVSGEWMWAEAIGNDRYVMDNSPYDIYDLSNRDVVIAKEKGGVLVFDRVFRRGGHSTYRIKLPRCASHSEFLSFWPEMARLGCKFEGSQGNRPLYSIDVPPGADIKQIYKILENGESEGKFEFEEAHYCRPEERS